MQSPPSAIVHVVDDEAEMRDSLHWLLDSVGMKVACYSSPDEFLQSFHDSSPGCLVFDVRMPGASGLDLFETLKARGTEMPVIFITAFADVPMAVRALKSGAVEFVEKPFNRHALLERVQRAVQLDVERWERTAELKGLEARFGRLTERERSVLDCLKQGRTNREISEQMQITPRAVEMRRSSLMKKTGANSLAELLRFAWILEAGMTTDS